MSEGLNYLGIDIGGTNTEYAIVNEAGEFLIRDTLPTQSDKPATVLFDRLADAIGEALRASPCTFAGVGVGAPNANYYNGSIEHPPNLSWGIVDLREELRRRFNCPVVVTNDANAAALGEMCYGAAKGMSNFVQITLGTGLGAGIVLNGVLVHGHSGYAGEMGHLTVKHGNRECGCGRRGCLEAYVSATGLMRTTLSLMSHMRVPSELRSVSMDKLNSFRIFEAAEHGDEIARTAFQRCGTTMGEAFADVAALLSPEAFIIGGGLAKAGDWLLAPARRTMDESLIPVLRGKVRIVSSSLPGADAGVLGAAALIMQELLRGK